LWSSGFTISGVSRSYTPWAASKKPPLASLKSCSFQKRVMAPPGPERAGHLLVGAGGAEPVERGGRDR
jgi:hypothetical protein